MDPVSAVVIGWLTSQAMTSGQRTLARMLGGDRQQGALQKIVQAAIVPAVAAVVADSHQGVVADALLRQTPDLSVLRADEVLSLQDALLKLMHPRLQALAEQGYRVDADRLSVVLAERIATGIQLEAVRNGLIRPITDLLHHQGLMKTGTETVKQLREVNYRLEQALDRPIQAAVHVDSAAESTAAAAHMLPKDNAFFTGRSAELRRLMRQLHHGNAVDRVVGIYTIDGMPGVGKTALAVHAAQKHALGRSHRAAGLRCRSRSPPHRCPTRLRRRRRPSNLVLGSPKSHQSRTVPIPRFLASELSRLIDRKQSEDLIFTTPSGSTLRLPNWRGSAFHRGGGCNHGRGSGPRSDHHPNVRLAAGIPLRLLRMEVPATARGREKKERAEAADREGIRGFRRHLLGQPYFVI